MRVFELEVKSPQIRKLILGPPSMTSRIYRFAVALALAGSIVPSALAQRGLQADKPEPYTAPAAGQRAGTWREN
jgi:hypothetical protein